MNTPRARVLVVDDDETVSEILSRYLVREGFVVDTVADGTAALAQAAAWQPDLIVLDLMLPDVSGLEICRRLRASESSSVPIIMLTARGEERERIFGLRLGADDYIVKPFSPREVAARVASVLRRTNGSLGASGDEPITLTTAEIDVDHPLVLTFQGERVATWEQTLQRIERERALVRARATGGSR